MKRTHITNTQRREWSALGHLLLLDAIASASGLSCKQFAFQGGTSLHLGWGSPRFSEDLDFLIINEAAGKALTKAMTNVERRLRQSLNAHDPRLLFELKNTTKNADRMSTFMLTISHPEVIGVAKVKSEFWTVDSDYLAKYETAMRTPVMRGDLIARIDAPPLPFATLPSVLADKVVALAYRPNVKWRDFFDVWWIAEQIEHRLPDLDTAQIASRAIAHAKAYDGPGIEAGLRALLEQRDALMRGDKCDLDRWLPEPLAKLIVPDRIPEIVATTLTLARQVLAQIESPDPGRRFQRTAAPSL